MATATKTASRKRRRPAARGPEAGWAIRGAGGVGVLSCDALSRIRWVVHGFSTRGGGESVLLPRDANSAKEHVLNLGFTEWDSRETVLRNRRKWQKALRAGEAPLLAMRQIHSDVAYVIGAAGNRFETVAFPAAESRQGDAMITREPGVLLGIQTADCVPILLVDEKTRAVAAIHAGWRGTLARIVSKTLGRMRFEFGTQPRDVTAALGPAIGRCCYEVGPEVAQAFASQFPAAAEWFDGPCSERLLEGEEQPFLPWLSMIPPGHQPPPERVQLDLRAANRWQLQDAGVPAENIFVSSLCTACRTDLFFSYRREGASTGRLMGAIGMAAASSDKSR